MCRARYRSSVQAASCTSNNGADSSETGGREQRCLREYKRERSSLQAGHNQRLLGHSSKRKVAMAAMAAMGESIDGITHTLPAPDAKTRRGIAPSTFPSLASSLTWPRFGLNEVSTDSPPSHSSKHGSVHHPHHGTTLKSRLSKLLAPGTGTMRVRLVLHAEGSWRYPSGIVLRHGMQSTQHLRGLAWCRRSQCWPSHTRPSASTLAFERSCHRPPALHDSFLLSWRWKKNYRPGDKLT